MKLLDKGHYGVKLTAEQRRRLNIWMDTYAQVSGSHSAEQAAELRKLRERLSPLLSAHR